MSLTVIDHAVRRFRHLNSIVGRCLQVTTFSLLSSFAVIYKGKDATIENLVYQTEVAENTQNPHWSPLEKNESFLRTLAYNTVFTVAIYNAKTTEVIIQSTFDFRAVDFFCSLQGLVEKSFSEAQILLELDDGFYLPREELNAFQDYDDLELQLSKEAKDACQLTVADIGNNGLRLVRLCYAIQEMDHKKAVVLNKVDDLLQKMRDVKEKEARCAACRHRIAHLTERIKKNKQMLFSEQQSLARFRQSYRTQVQTLTDQKETLRYKKKCLEEMEKEIRESKRPSCGELTRCIESRREQLVSMVAKIFPIELDSTHHVHTIVGMKLSSSESFGTDEEAAAALGYVAHALQLLSKIWAVQLRYKVYPICSRSYVQEDFIDMTSLIHPLFHQRGCDKYKYFKSIFLLNRGLHQLLRVRGYSIRKERYMLMNLKYLLSGPKDPTYLADAEPLAPQLTHAALTTSSATSASACNSSTVNAIEPHLR